MCVCVHNCFVGFDELDTVPAKIREPLRMMYAATSTYIRPQDLYTPQDPRFLLCTVTTRNCRIQQKSGILLLG